MIAENYIGNAGVFCVVPLFKGVCFSLLSFSQLFFAQRHTFLEQQSVAMVIFQMIV